MLKLSVCLLVSIAIWSGVGPASGEELNSLTQPIVAIQSHSEDTLPESAQKAVESFKAALTDLGRQITASPTNIALLTKRAELLSSVQLYGLAADDYEDAFYLSERDPVYLMQQAYCMALSGDLESALWLSHRTLMEYPDLASAHNVKALCLINRDSSRALKEVAIAIKQKPQESEFYLTRAKIWLSENNYLKAQESATLAIKAKPDNWQAYQVRSEALSKLKKYSEALSDCQKLIQANAASPASYSSRAEVYRDMSKSESGEVDMEIAFKIKAVLWQVEP
ncbi:MAG: hypothetical protein IPJ49_15195 [Candidatus Obscuribacter sp.]|nr:hypothetical protein [Candidatus Obscuribacter sp.]